MTRMEGLLPGEVAADAAVAPLNIAYVLVDPGIGVFGTKGASVHVQEVVRAFRADGHNVSVFCVRTNDAIPQDLEDLDVRQYKLPPTSSTGERERAVEQVSRTIADDVIAGGFDLVYERYSLFGTSGARIAQETGIAFILEVNAPLVREQQQHRSLIHVDRAHEATAMQLQAAHVVSCVSPAVAQWAIGEGARADATVVTPNGVNTDRIFPGPRSGAAGADAAGAEQDADSPVVVGFVGTLKPWHGTDVLVRAFAAADPGAVLDICGTGPEQENLEALARDCGVSDRVRFRGAVEPAHVPQVLQQFDIGTAPYPAGDHYFSPLKVYEYFAAGLPTIASAIGTLPQLLGYAGDPELSTDEAVQAGPLGVLVAPGDEVSLTEAINALVRNPRLRRELGKRAREVAVREHTWLARTRALLSHPQVRAVVNADGGTDTVGPA